MNKTPGKFKLYPLLAIITAFGLLSIITTCGDDDDDDGPNDYYFWESLGSPGVGWVTPSAIAIDPSGNKPVVVFRDMTDGRPHVMKWSDGTSWTDMGFLTSYMGDHPSLTLDPSDNKPVVVFVDNANNGRTRVMKWDSDTSWTDLGFASTGDTRGWWRQPSIVLDPSDNKPIVAFADGDNGWRIHVKKWSSFTSWTSFGFVGSGVGYYPSVAIDPSDNKPVVAFVDVANSDRAHVMKWSNYTSWTDLGFLSTGVTASTVMAVDPSDNNPVVAFVNTPSDPALQVKKWSSGTSWTDLGNPSKRWSDSPSIAIDPSDNKPVVAFRDWANDDYFYGTGNGLHVKKWSSGTSWTGLGYPSEGPSAGASITIDPIDFKPIVIYGDSVDGSGNVYVSKHP